MKIEYEIGNKYSGFEFNDNNHVASCRVIRTSPYSGETNELILSITKEQYFAWRDGTLIQNAFPNLTIDEREFILTGLLGDEFNKFVGEDDEEDYTITADGDYE